MQFAKIVILINFSKENWIYIDLTHISQCFYLFVELGF